MQTEVKMNARVVSDSCSNVGHNLIETINNGTYCHKCGKTLEEVREETAAG